MTHPSHTQAIAMGATVDRETLHHIVFRCHQPEIVAECLVVLTELAVSVRDRWQQRQPGADLVSLLSEIVSADHERVRWLAMRSLYVEVADRPLRALKNKTMVRHVQAWEQKIWRKPTHILLGISRVVTALNRVHAMKMAVRHAQTAGKRSET